MAQVGVLVPVYNGEKYIRQALESVLGQTFTDFIVYVVNDGSTDGTAAIVKSFSDTRIRLIEKPANSGITDTLNTGLKEISEEFIVRFDADDICHPNRLQAQVEFMQANPDVIVCGTQVEYTGNQQGTSNLSLDNDTLKAELLVGSCFIHPSVIIRTSALKQHNIQYPAGFPHLEDYALWRILAPYGKFANLNKTLLTYRIEGQNISLGNFQTKAERLKRIYPEILREYGMDVTEENIDLHLELSGVKPVANAARMVKHGKRIIAAARRKGNHPAGKIEWLVSKRQELLFFKESDRSRSFAWSYWWSRKKIRGVELRYYLSTLFRSRKNHA